MRLLKILKNSFAPILKRLGFSSLALSLTLSLLNAAPALALETRIIDIVSIDEEATFDEAVEVVLKEGHSRTPLYRESIDHVSGILYAKDLLRIIAAGGPRPRLRDIMRPALFVPESKPVDDLLHELQRRKVHMAIVLDEHGGTAGLVTIEDLLEEIVGEIQDEFDEEEPMKVEISEGEVILDGRADIDELTDLIDPPLELEDDEEYDTLGGFVYHRIGRVPVVGDSVTIAPFDISVIKVRDLRWIGESRWCRRTGRHAPRTRARPWPQNGGLACCCPLSGPAP